MSNAPEVVQCGIQLNLSLSMHVAFSLAFGAFWPHFFPPKVEIKRQNNAQVVGQHTSWALSSASIKGPTLWMRFAFSLAFCLIPQALMSKGQRCCVRQDGKIVHMNLNTWRELTSASIKCPTLCMCFVFSLACFWNTNDKCSALLCMTKIQNTTQVQHTSGWRQWLCECVMYFLLTVPEI